MAQLMVGGHVVCHVMCHVSVFVHLCLGYLRNELTGRSYKFVDMENVWQEIFVALTLMVIFVS